MVHHFLAAPFADVARAGQYAAVLAALQAEADPDTLLLGNLVLEDGAVPLDAVVVRPHSLTLLVLVPRGGRLGIPALAYGGWQLDGGPLPGVEDFDNPFEQFTQQKAALETWLRPRFGPAQANLRAISGLVVFAGPVTFGADVEAALRDAPAGFQLLREPAELASGLAGLASPEINLSAADIEEWAAEWAAFTVASPPDALPAPEARPESVENDSAAAAANTSAAAPAPESSFLGQKARALWGWLGAADVPDDDLPYGADPTGAAARREEKEHLEHLRQQMQADLTGQLQALEAREAERERSIAQLRAELAQAPPVAAEAAALVSRLGAETREKAALEAEMQASRAESAARNQELDSKIEQLGLLIERLNAPAAPGPAPEVAPEAVAPLAAAIAPREAPAVPVTPTPTPRPVVAPTPVATLAATPAPPLPIQTAPPRLAPVPASVASVPWQQKLKEEATLRFARLRAWGQGLPKLRLAVAAGAVTVLVLGGWGLSHMGGSPPVPFQDNGRWGFADAKGQPVIAAQFTAAGPFQAGRAVVAKAGAYGMIDEAGKEVIAPAYDALNPLVGGYARARVDDAYTFVSEDGQEFDRYYFNALDFAEGHAAVLDHRGWHYITGHTEPDQPAIFLEAYFFAEGLARVKLADGFTFVTPAYLDDPSAGTKPFGRYEQATDFAEGKARVTQNGRSFEIDKSGAEVK